MRLLNYIALSLFALVGFISCEMREEIKSGKEGVDMGLLKLSVQAKSPAVTKATSVSTDDFPVSIVGKSVDGEEVERNYDAVADLPESILLPVGTYSVVSHTKGVLEKKLEAPYYKGSSDMEIKKDITSSAKVTCKMQNSRIQLNYSSDFWRSLQNGRSCWMMARDCVVSSGNKRKCLCESCSYLLVFW